MKVLSDRELRLNQLEIVFLNEKNEIIKRCYPKISQKEELYTILKRYHVHKVELRGTISYKNIEVVERFFDYLRMFNLEKE